MRGFAMMLCGIVAWSLALPPASVGQEETRKRPVVDENPKWLQDWWNFSNAQRRKGANIISKTGGSLNPKWDDDPQVRTWTDQYGFNLRPIVPQDLRSAIQMQEKVLGEMKSTIETQEREINRRIADAKQRIFLARDDEKAAKAAVSNADLELYNVDRRWDTSRFDRCPRGNPWDQCDHSAEKSGWLADWQADRAPYERGKERAEKKIEDARIKAQRADADLRKAQNDQNGLQSMVESYQSFSAKQKAGEPFLFMPK